MASLAPAHSVLASLLTGSRLFRFLLSFAILLAMASNAQAQNASATWPLTTNGTATITGSLTGAAVAKGAGATQVGYGTTGYAVKGISATSLATAQSGNAYIQFEVGPFAGYTFNISSITTTNRVSAVALGTNAARFQLLYSTAADFSVPVALGTEQTLTATTIATTQTPVGLEVANGKKIYLRIYAWGLAGTTTEWATKDVRITGNACPAVSITYPEVAYCKDPATTATPSFSGPAGGTYTSTSGLVINSTTGVVDVTNSTAGTYTVTYTVSGGTGCSVITGTTTIRLNNLPQAFTLLGPDGSTSDFCTNGTPATFTLSGSQAGVTYTFNAVNPGGNAPPGQNFTVPGVGGTLEFVQTPDGKWSYKVTGTDDATGCTNTMNGTLTAVDGPAVATDLPATLALCAGGASTTLSLNVSNANALKWEMSTNGGITWSAVTAGGNYSINNSGSTTARLTITGYTTAMNGYRFRVVMGGPASCPTNYSTATVLNVGAPITITSQPVSKTVCNNSLLSLSVTATNAQSFQWYKNGTAITGATAATYSATFNAITDAGNYTVVMTSPCGNLTSNTAVISASNSTGSTTWQGPGNGGSATTGTDWTVPANWSCGLPSATTDAVIPVNILDGYPTIKPGVNAQVRNLTVNGGGFSGSLTVLGKLSVYGTINNTGTFDVSAGTLELAGTNPQTLNGSSFANSTVENLVISNNVTLTAPLTLTGTLSFGAVNNKTFATAGYFTLGSGSLATAKVADLTNNKGNTGNSITGNVTVERYIPAWSSRRYRLLTAPVTGITINAAWQEGSTWNGTTTLAAAGQGTLITGQQLGSATAANAAGFDFWSAIANSSASVRSFIPGTGALNGSWLSLASTTTPAAFDNGQAYLLFVRGDRSVSAGSASNATILRPKGVLKQGTYTLPMSNGAAYTLIGNPFAAPLSFASFYNDNAAAIQNYFWIWDATLGNGTGGYLLVQPIAGGFELIPGDGTATAATGYIQSGQGFFVVPKVYNPGSTAVSTLTLAEHHKAADKPAKAVFRESGEAAPKCSINLVSLANGRQTLVDGAQLQFAIAGTNIEKNANGSENLALLAGNTELILATRPAPKAGDTVQLKIWNTTAAAYRLELTTRDLPGTTGLTVVLQDRYTGTETLLAPGNDRTEYSFETAGGPAAGDPLRFRIVFRATAASPLQLTAFDAEWKNNTVVLNWSVENEGGTELYTLQRSVNGTTYKTIGEQKAGGPAATTAYETIDTKPAGLNFYRLKITAATGIVRYSSLVQVQQPKAATTDEAVRLYPNPLTFGSGLTLQLQNSPAGRYALTLFNAAGQPVFKQDLLYGGGVASYSLPPSTHMATGLYTLRLMRQNGTETTIPLLVNQ